ncbi:MAG: hypothetical protein KDB65_05235 [Calditrichaeota bacterium]|nr:hypothetical protein [Calditrichota bacterium]MCB9368280.1 hypothetical protein [Calditrichota bacterium]
MRPILALSVLLGILLIFGQTEAARRRTHLPALDWGLRVGVNTIYNDNVLRLSGPDQDAFRRYDPTFRTPIETVDDGETEFSIHPSVQWRAPQTTMISAVYRFKDVRRVKNDFSNYQTHSLTASLRPRVRGYKWQAQVSAFTIPSFYLRVYRDRDYGTYEDARFRNWEYNGEFSVRPHDALWLSLQGGWGSYYYNAKFTEYDTEYSEVGLEARYATPWRPTLTARYTRRVSTNVGRDQSINYVPSYDNSQILEDNEYGDGDNNEDEFRLAIRSPLKFIKPITLDGSLSTRLRRRIFTTDRSILDDPFHRGRLDNRWEITPSLSWDALSSLEVSTYFTYEQRDSKSDVPGVSQVKNFVRREVGLGLTYKIN